MNYYKLIELVSARPELWDRSNSSFRELKIKEQIWQDVGVEMGETAASCKDGFKHLREKYIREREKMKIHQDSSKSWEMLPHLAFLEHHIIPRKSHPIPTQQVNIIENTTRNLRNIRTYSSIHQKKTTKIEETSDTTSTNAYNTPAPSETYQHLSQSRFDRLLVEMVKKTSLLWNWNDINFSNRKMKTETWEVLAENLNKSASECTLRWKSLREKYIREKMKNKDDKYKWELLDSMSFLDQVIHYRGPKSNSDSYSNQHDIPKENKSSNSFNSEFFFGNESSTSTTDYHYQVIADENSTCDPINESQLDIKQEYNEVPDSSYDSDGLARKRRVSTNSCCSQKKQKEEKSSEDLFGELVASLLARKSESERHLAMVDIMKILAK